MRRFSGSRTVRFLYSSYDDDTSLNTTKYTKIQLQNFCKPVQKNGGEIFYTFHIFSEQDVQLEAKIRLGVCVWGGGNVRKNSA